MVASIFFCLLVLVCLLGVVLGVCRGCRRTVDAWAPDADEGRGRPR